MLCVTHSLIVILWKMKYNGYLATGPFIAYSGGITLDRLQFALAITGGHVHKREPLKQPEIKMPLETRQMATRSVCR